MFTGIEIPFTFALLYPTLNYLWFPIKKKEIEKEIKYEPNQLKGIELYNYEIKKSGPTYVLINNVNVAIPNNNTYREENKYLSKHLILDQKKSDPNHYNDFWQINDKEDIGKSLVMTKTIVNKKMLDKILKNYDITDQDKTNFPLKANIHKYKNGAYYIYVHRYKNCAYHKAALIATDKEKLIKYIFWNSKRLPFTSTVFSIGVTGLSLLWFDYAFYYSTSSYKPTDYPPFHYKRFL